MHDANDLWAVIITGNGVLLGRAEYKDAIDMQQAMNTQAFVTLNPVYEMHMTMNLMRDGKIQKTSLVSPFLNTFHGAPLHTKVVAYQLLSEMTPADQEIYRKLIKQAEEAAISLSADAAGIKRPNQH
jgi:hypothetical protein